MRLLLSPPNLWPVVEYPEMKPDRPRRHLYSRCLLISTVVRSEQPWQDCGRVPRVWHLGGRLDLGPAAREGSKEAGRQGAACGYELRRVRDVRFFDGVVISPDMFSAHLLSSVVRSLEALAGEKD